VIYHLLLCSYATLCTWAYLTGLQRAVELRNAAIYGPTVDDARAPARGGNR
jgi:hypothetical protein